MKCFYPVAGAKSVRNKTFIILILFWSGISCTAQNEPEIPAHLSSIQNLVIIQPDSESSSSVELIRDTVINDNHVASTWFKDIVSVGWAFGGSDWMGGLEVDDSGKIYVGNRRTMEIQVFDSEGRYLENTGGVGNGPGEFRGMTEMRIQADQLSVFDFLQFRTTFFSLDPLQVDEVKIASVNRTPDIEELTAWFSTEYMLMDDERFLIKYANEATNTVVGSPNYNLDKKRIDKYYIVNREGTVVSEKLFELNNQAMITADVGGRHLWNMAPVPFLNQPMVFISDDGHIISANSKEALIKMHAPNGDYLRAFYLPLEKKSIGRDELLTLYGAGGGENENLLQHAELPEKWPALADIILDDEKRLWISTITDAENLTHEWWVLDEKGVLLDKFTWPADQSIDKIKNGYMYTRETDEETGLQQIVRYRVWVKSM